MRFAGQFGLAPSFVKPKYSRIAEYVKSLTFRNETMLNTVLYALAGKRVSPYTYFASTPDRRRQE